MGSFRFCRSCGLDYDSPVPDAPTPAPAILAPVPETPPVVLPEVGSTGTQPQPRPAGDVIVIQKQQLRLWAGVLVGGIIGMLLAGALVVPFFGEDGVLLGLVAGIVTVVLSAWLGMRVVRARAYR